MTLRPQGTNREHVDVVSNVVAAEGRRRSDNGAKLGLGVACRRVGGDLLAQALDIPDAVGYLGLAELDFQRRPAAVAKLDRAESKEQPLQALIGETRAIRLGHFGSICGQGLTSLSEVGILYFRGISNSIFEGFHTSFSKYNPVNSSGIVAEIETAVEEGPINQIEPPHHFLDMRNGEALDARDPCQVFGHA